MLAFSLTALFITWFLLMLEREKNKGLEKENKRLRRQLGINDFD
tara:strand:- start:450 stop:581 length:132 start_codon:yes stop_codon:yes gene_type:complete